MRLVIPAIALAILVGGIQNEYYEGGDAGSEHVGADLRPKRDENQLAARLDSIDRRDSISRSTPTPTPSPVVTASPVPVQASIGQEDKRAEVPTPHPETIVLTNDVEELVCQQSWDCLTALNIMWCESGGRPDATNGNHYGLFQISGIWAERFPEFWSRWMEPGYNIMMATTLWSESGWQPWACRR